MHALWLPTIYHAWMLLIAAEFMGFDHYIPPFATASGPEILEGVNYASGGAGIRNETGQFAVN